MSSTDKIVEDSENKGFSFTRIGIKLTTKKQYKFQSLIDYNFFYYITSQINSCNWVLTYYNDASLSMHTNHSIQHYDALEILKIFHQHMRTSNWLHKTPCTVVLINMIVSYIFINNDSYFSKHYINYKISHTYLLITSS